MEKRKNRPNFFLLTRNLLKEAATDDVSHPAWIGIYFSIGIILGFVADVVTLPLVAIGVAVRSYGVDDQEDK